MGFDRVGLDLDPAPQMQQTKKKHGKKIKVDQFRFKENTIFFLKLEGGSSSLSSVPYGWQLFSRRPYTAPGPALKDEKWTHKRTTKRRTFFFFFIFFFFFFFFFFLYFFFSFSRLKKPKDASKSNREEVNHNGQSKSLKKKQ